MTHGKRYITVRNGVVYDDYHGASASTAEEYIECEPESTFTGLYDHDGTPLHRQREPIGYNPHRWSKPMPGPNQKKQPKTKKKGKC